MSKEKKKFGRMTIPKSEADFQTIEEEIHEHEEFEEFEEEPHAHLHSYGEGENLDTILLNAIAHTLGHIESDISSVNQRLKELTDGFNEIKSLLSALVKALLLREIRNEKAKKKLMLDILQGLKE